MASTNLERKHAFVFSEEDVNKIWRVLSDNVGEVEAEVSCSDDVNRTFHSPDALMAYENARRSSIVSMRIRAVPSDFSKRASMSFARRKYGPPVEFEIEGPEDAVVRSKSQLTDVIDGMRPWYSFLARLDFFLVAMILATFMFSVGLLVSNDAGEVSDPIGLKKAAILTALSAGIILGFFVFVKGMSWLRGVFFPIAVFAIGQGKRRNDFYEKVRWGVLIAFVVGVLVSVFVKFLF